jgi:hypothetical protein
MARGEETPTPIQKGSLLRREIAVDENFASRKKKEGGESATSLTSATGARRSHKGSDVELLRVHMRQFYAFQLEENEAEVDFHRLLVLEGDRALKESLHDALASRSLLTPTLRNYLKNDTGENIFFESTGNSKEDLISWLSETSANDIIAFSEIYDLEYGQAFRELQKISGTDPEKIMLSQASLDIKTRLPLKIED